jgi:hypothetical protein
MSTSPSKPAAKSSKTLAASAGNAKDPLEGIISSEVETALHTAFVNARARRHEYVTIEHLLLGLLDAPSTKATLIGCGAEIDDLRSKLNIFIDEHTPVKEGVDEVDTQPTLGFQRIVQRSIMHVRSETQGSARSVVGNDLLLSMFGEKDSHAVHYLQQQGVARSDVIEFLTHGAVKDRNSKEKRQAALSTASDVRADHEVFSIVSAATQPFVAIEANKTDRPKLFISYSHVDTACLERLLVHLKPLERSNTVVCWSDRRLRTGDKWRAELEKNLGEAVIAILLVSADFLASDFIVNNELPPLLIKADSKGLRILPVVLKPCGFRRDPVLSTFQSANDPATPLLGMGSMEQEALYDKIAEEVAKEIGMRRSTPS